jgi:Zn-dependent protease with chaperone function
MAHVLLGALLVLLAAGQSINFFSLKQDVEIGSESAKEAEQSLSLLASSSLPHRYVSSVGYRITQNRSLPALKYRYRVVNSMDINSVGFPGGAIYLNRGLLEIASNDDEVAAIVAHEVSHIASRHGTAQLSRQLMVQAPLKIAAGTPLTEVWRDEIAKLGIALGIDAPFVRYNGDQELEAGLMTVQLMSDARFDPNAFRTLMDKINEAETSDVARRPVFLFNHPQSQTLAPDIDERIDKLSTPSRRARASADFRAFRSALLKLAVPVPALIETADADSADGLPEVFIHPMDYYRLSHPEGWQVTRIGQNGAIIAPADGVQPSRNGTDVSHGVMFDMFDISLPDRSLTLEQATNRLIAFLRQRNQTPADRRFVDPRVGTSWLRMIPGAQTQTLISGEPGIRTVMIGRPDTSSQQEIAWVVTRLYYQSLFYMVFVAPEDEFPTYQPVFEQMIRSVRLR